MPPIIPRFCLISCVVLVAAWLCPAFNLSAASGATQPPAETAPAVFRVDFETSQGPIIVEITRANSPHGADRLYNLIKAKYFDNARFYRVVPGHIVQWGAAADPRISKAWDRPIPDDPIRVKNTRGTLVFAATSQPDSRTTHMFINLSDNEQLDEMGFAPFGEVVSGMKNAYRLYSGYAERPDQVRIAVYGNRYLQQIFPKLDYIKTAQIVP